jgi:glycosyltransferase involved in cell wall biosynthesis
MFPIKYTKKLASQLFSRQKKNKSEHDISLKILQNSGKFDATWYLSEYDDIAKEPYWSVNPALHYLLNGANEGRDPNSWFDSQWYLLTNPDVATQEMNPLLHYVLHGAKEKRLPNPYKDLDSNKKSSSKIWHIQRRLAGHLWGGLSAPALVELEEIKTDEKVKSSERWLAAWHQARWFYFLGDLDKAFEIAIEMDECLPANSKLVESVYLKSFCLFSFDKPIEASQIIQNHLNDNPDDSDAYFALANAFPHDDSERLKCINSAYALLNYLPIALKDDSSPLSFSNIVSFVPEFVSGEKRVSIIMPVYSAQDHLHIAVESLLNQTYKNIEVIIVDDCSPDDTFALAKAFAQRDKRVMAVQQVTNGGAYSARNTGLKYASGDFITTHDSDDWSHPQKIETQINYFTEHPEKVGICACWIRARQDMFFTQNWRPNNALIHWSHSSFMFKRKVYEVLGGWDNVRVGGDTEFIWRMKSHYGDASYALIAENVPLAIALDDEGSLTRTKLTHVKTVYFGLRHIYREICSWWHREAKSRGLVLDINSDFSRASIPVPTAMVDRTGAHVQVDVLLISDFTNDDMSNHIYKIIELFKSEGIVFGLFHWPNFDNSPSSLTGRYFSSLEGSRVMPVVSGELLSTKIAVVAEPTLLKYQVDALPNFATEFESYLLSTNAKEHHLLLEHPLCLDTHRESLEEITSRLKLMK